ncbi:hypothetical protein [Kordia sp.]|nr:hypothetical protein [Kordia sp.]MCH2195477.1 hypothetical protein [Kordia sp.]
MKRKSLKFLPFRRTRISNFQGTETREAKSWGHSCFTSLKVPIPFHQ